MNSQGKVGKGVNPLQITYMGKSYFAVNDIHCKLIDASLGHLTPNMTLLLCCVASFGSNGCTTRDIMKANYSYNDDSKLLRRLNLTLGLLVKRGLLNRSYRKLYISAHAEKLFSGKL